MESRSAPRVPVSRPPTLLRLAALIITLVFTMSPSPVCAADRLRNGFITPPEQTKPWCYWYWISDHISREGITRDLEAMAQAGIGEALIGNIFLDDVPAGPIKVLSPEWWSLVEHALREGERTGVNIGLFNCPGWSQSGGPWIKPEQSMRYLAASETRVSGPAPFAQRLPAPKEPFQEIAVLAFPAPQNDSDRLSAKSPQVGCSPPVADARKICDGDADTSLDFPGNAGRDNSSFSVEFEVAEPFTARSLQVIPGAEPFGANCELQASDSAGNFKTVRQFKCDRSNMSPGVGFMPRGPVMISFPATQSKKFRVIFRQVFGSGRASLAEVDLSGAARLESCIEKQLGKMHPTPLPLWDAYLWPTQPEPDSPQFAVPAGSVRDITRNLADGQGWEVPRGEWIIQRIGMTPTGMKNSPASPEGQGLEVDKMNRAFAKHHFESFIGELLRRVPASGRKALTRVIADSYEMGSQNWTDGFGEQFQKEYGYDPVPWLPVLFGRLVGSADQSERFLWDLRRIVADRVATEYVGGMRDACQPHGPKLWLENYGHWGFPSEFLKYGSESDRVGGEYWVTGDLGSIECRAASSCANTYGKSFVSAEAFTGGPAFQNAPGALKARGDWSFCEGVNHFVLHVYIHQPWEDKVPGANAWFGTEFNRHNTWFAQSKSWVEYLRRCCWLLQQGTRVADVAYFIGEDTPKMTGVRAPELPAGRDFDYINADVIQKTLRVENGGLVLPHGTRYRVLVLPELDTMRPELLRKVHDLVKKGATVVGRPPKRSPSMQNYPECDLRVRELAGAIWGDADTTRAGERRFGKGRIIWGKPLEEILSSLDSPLDFASSTKLRFTHRHDKDIDIYFVANPKAEPVTTAAAFRAGNKAPELWFADSGRIEHPAVYDAQNGVVRLPLFFGPYGSVFVVFREKAGPASERVLSVTSNGKELLGTNVKSEVRELAQSMARSDQAGDVPAIWLTREARRFRAHGGVAGEFELHFADGKSRTLKMGGLPAAQPLDGPWEVRFNFGWGAPAQKRFEQLIDWSQHSDAGIKFYSGKATYQKRFSLPAPPGFAAGRSKVILNLGVVKDIATVRLNGKEIGTLWLAPWSVDLTSALQPGENLLEVDVINVWNNRLVGDQFLAPEQRRTFLLAPTVSKNSPLLPAGLLGPVELKHVTFVDL